MFGIYDELHLNSHNSFFARNLVNEGNKYIFKACVGARLCMLFRGLRLVGMWVEPCEQILFYFHNF